MKKFEIVKEHKDFDNIINTGKYIKGRFYVIYNKDSEHRRFGIAVSKKFGSAVERNRIKRQTRMILENNKNIFKNNMDYIIIVKKNALNVDYINLESDIQSIIKG